MMLVLQLLKELIINLFDYDNGIRIAAIRNITDDSILTDIINASSSFVLYAAIKRSNSEDTLLKIQSTSSDEMAQEEARIRYNIIH